MLVALLLILTTHMLMPCLGCASGIVTCGRVLPPHLCHLGGSHSTAQDAASTLFMHGMLSLLLHFDLPAAADFTPPAPDVPLHDALLSLRVHQLVGGVAPTLLEVLHANSTRRSPRASAVRGFVALPLLQAASSLPLVGACVPTVLVAHLVTGRQVDLRAAVKPGELQTMKRRHGCTYLPPPPPPPPSSHDACGGAQATSGDHALTRNLLRLQAKALRLQLTGTACYSAARHNAPGRIVQFACLLWARA